MDQKTNMDRLSVYITRKRKDQDNGDLICIEEFTNTMNLVQKLAYTLRPGETRKKDFKLYIKDYTEGSALTDVSFSDNISREHKNFGILLKNTFEIVTSGTEKEIEEHLLKNYGHGKYKQCLEALEKICEIDDLNVEMAVKDSSNMQLSKNDYIRINTNNALTKVSKLKSGYQNIVELPLHGIIYELDIENKSFRLKTIESKFKGTYQNNLKIGSLLNDYLEHPVEIYAKINRNKRNILEVYEIKESNGVPLSSLGKMAFKKEISLTMNRFKTSLNAVLENENKITRYIENPTEELTAAIENLEKSLKFGHKSEERTAIFGNYVDLFLLFMDKYEENKNNSPLRELKVLFDKHLVQIISDFPERMLNGDKFISGSIETYDIILKNEIQTISDEMFKIEKRYCDLLPCCDEIYGEFGKLPFDSETCEELRNNLKGGK
ncbi:hypothetical protein [Methanococcus maripaludis]|uniref:Uncharacterized protein n=1 Tax=Methanococcus maripaludis TaxID=39152 RepID=A0A8T4CJA9_METMI|nr:hypothetical protein [Methanococcus maripaludis]MBM7408447.1 hypothetical protein [Methanococcus maripaludis]MBP2220245.1 hypothetical protein [Methanococcus maripaludis]